MAASGDFVLRVRVDTSGAIASLERVVDALKAMNVEPEVLDNDPPGMWEKADFEGGAPDEVRGPDYTPPEPKAEWEYGFYDSEDQAQATCWSTFGGLVGFDTVEAAEHTGSKSCYGQTVVVRRLKGSTDWEVVD